MSSTDLQTLKERVPFRFHQHRMGSLHATILQVYADHAVQSSGQTPGLTADAVQTRVDQTLKQHVKITDAHNLLWRLVAIAPPKYSRDAIEAGQPDPESGRNSMTPGKYTITGPGQRWLDYWNALPDAQRPQPQVLNDQGQLVNAGPPAGVQTKVGGATVEIKPEPAEPPGAAPRRKPGRPKNGA